MSIDDNALKSILLTGGYVTEDDLAAAEKFAQKSSQPLSNYFLIHELLTKDLLGQAIAEYYSVPYADLNSNKPAKQQAVKVSEEIAKKHRVVLFSESDKSVVVTTDDPKQSRLKTILRPLFAKKKITLAYSLPEDIDDVLVYYRQQLTTRFAKIVENNTHIAPEIIKEIIEDALTYRASDIHFEPQEQVVVIRFRIDSVLHEVARISTQYYENILNRIKVMARLHIDEHFTPQDGSIRLEYSAGPVDMRVSIVPALDGEKIVIRLLAEYVRGFNLTDLGLSDQQQEQLTTAIKKPFGMILVAGPTGSGKTTTLYSLLKLSNEPEVNITTIEDPVEYRIPGVTQIQVNKQKGITFVQGLRSIVRQDPDIILVGEIRDAETAEIAVNAALTGHLVLSTFHANDAATTIPRLLDMNVEPFLLSSTLELIIAQRLVRTLCERCRTSYRMKRSQIKKDYPFAVDYLTGQTITLYKGKGCDNCGQTGYSGRTTILEIIANTAQMRELILQKPSTTQVWELARSQGSISFFENGIEKVLQGKTTIEELARVARPSHS